MTDYTMDTTPDMDADLRHEDELRQSQSKWEGVFGKPNVAMPERIASSLAGAALATYAITKKRDAGGAALALAGGMLLYRGVTGQCMGYAVMRTGTAKDESNDTAVIPHGRGIKVEKSVTIQKTADELFDFWRDFTNLPRFMAHLESVTIQDETRSHWVAKAPLGKTVEWDAEIINEKPGEMIAWRSTDNADIPNTGSVCSAPYLQGGEPWSKSV